MKEHKKRKKRAVTLVELIVVIALITIITAALAVNYRGSLNEGKKFKREQIAEKICNILEIESSRSGLTLEEAVQQWKKLVEESPLGGTKFYKDADELKPKIEIQVVQKDNQKTIVVQ